MGIQDYCYCVRPVFKPDVNGGYRCGLCSKPPQPIDPVQHIPDRKPGQKNLQYLKDNLPLAVRSFLSSSGEDFCMLWGVYPAVMIKMQEEGLFPHKRERIKGKRPLPPGGHIEVEVDAKGMLPKGHVKAPEFPRFYKRRDLMNGSVTLLVESNVLALPAKERKMVTEMMNWIEMPEKA